MKRIASLLTLALVALGASAATIPIQLDSVTRLLVTPTNAWTANKTNITAAVLATPTTSSSVAGWLTDETGSGNVVFSASPTFTGQILTAAGSASAPSVSFAGDPNTGFYNYTADYIGVAVGGSLVGYFNQYGFGVGNGATAQVPFDVYSTAYNSALSTRIYNANTGNGAYAALVAQSDGGSLDMRSYSAAHSIWPDTGLIVASSLSGGVNLYQSTTGAPWIFWTEGTERMRILPTGGIAIGSGSDTVIRRRAANHLLTGPSTSASLTVANIDDLGLNYEWGGAWWNANILNIGTRFGGSGVARDINFVHGGTVKAYIGQYGLGVGTSATASIPGYFYGSSDGQQMLAMHNPNSGTAAFSSLGAYAEAGNVTLRAYSAAHATWPDYGLLFPSGLDSGFAFYTASSTMDWLWYANGLERMRLSDNGEFRISTPGALSQSSLLVNGAVGTGGTAATTRPLAKFGAGTDGNYNTSGSVLGLNPGAGFAGDLISAKVSGAADVFTVSSAGVVNIASAAEFRINNDAILGRDAAATLQLGSDAASPVNQSLKAADGSGTDKDGAKLTVSGGQSSGTGRSGDVIMRTGLTGTTGSSLNALSTRRYDSAKWVDLTESSASQIATVTCGTGKYLGAQFVVTVKSDDATDFQALTSVLNVNAVNKAGTITPTVTQVDGTTAASAGTLTATYTVTDNGSGVLGIKVNAVSSLTQTTLRAKWSITALNSDDAATVTPN